MYLNSSQFIQIYQIHPQIQPNSTQNNQIQSNLVQLSSTPIKPIQANPTQFDLIQPYSSWCTP